MSSVVIVGCSEIIVRTYLNITDSHLRERDLVRQASYTACELKRTPRLGYRNALSKALYVRPVGRQLI